MIPQSILQKYSQMRFSRPRFLTLLVFAALVGLSARAANASLGAGLTHDESRRLEAGQLVVRPAERDKGSLHLLGGTSYQVIDADPVVVWKALLDTSRYHRMMPRVIEARLVSDAERERTVFMRQGAEGFIERRYYLKVKVDRERRDMTFMVDDRRPHDLDAAWGFYSVRPHSGGRTLLTYGVMADLGEGLLRTVVTGTVHDWMMRVPWMVKRFVEGSGKWIYK